MEELVKDGDDFEWKETARWVKFEEDVEEGGNRWSKPHVATLSLHSLFELRSLLTNGTVMLDMDASHLDEISDLVCDNMVNAGTLPIGCREKVREALLRRHRHQHERDVRKKDNNMSRLPIIRSLAEIGRNHSSSKSMYICFFFLYILLYLWVSNYNIYNIYYLYTDILHIFIKHILTNHNFISNINFFHII